MPGPVSRRREAARKMPLACGCRDPLACDLARWCPFFDGPRPEAGLDVAADHLDRLDLCACWTVPRQHGSAS
jgi:hypothetical protein